MRAMLRQAQANELLLRDVFAGHRWSKVLIPEPDPYDAGERDRLVNWFQTKRFRIRRADSDGYTLVLHPPYHVFAHLLFWTGMRPSEAAGLQWGDLDLRREVGIAVIRRSRHLGEYGEPKTASARRTVELFPETVALLRSMQPLRVLPGAPVFTNTHGTPIEPNSLLRHWYAA